MSGIGWRIFLVTLGAISAVSCITTAVRLYRKKELREIPIFLQSCGYLTGALMAYTGLHIGWLIIFGITGINSLIFWILGGRELIHRFRSQM